MTRVNRQVVFSCRLACTCIALVAVLAPANDGHAASGSWNGTTDSAWATQTNWSAAPVPGSGDTATFNNAGNGNTTIGLGAGVTVHRLVFDTANVAAYTIGSGAVGSETLTLNSSGTIALGGAVAANQLINANLATSGSTTVTVSAASRTLTFAGAVTGAGATLTKTGGGTLIFSGLSATAANNYTGSTILGGGTTTLTQNASFSGGLTFGTTSSDSNASTLNLNSASATFAGPTIFQATTVNNAIRIGAGQKLTSNGDVTFSTPGVANQTGVVLSGSGGWDVVASSGTFGGISAQNGNRMVVDMSGLAEFTANLRTGGSGSAGGVFRVGGIGGHTNDRTNLVSLATNSTVSADLVTLGMGGQLGSATLQLGNGTQIINTDTISMSTGARENTAINFRTADGTLKIRGTDGGDSTRSNLSMLSGVNTGSVRTSTFDVSGHEADLLFDSVRILDHTVNTSTLPNNYTATFSFDRGAFDANAVAIGGKSNGNLSNISAGVVNIGSGENLTNSARLGNVTMGVLGTTGTVAAGSGLTSTLNISGSSTTVNFTAISMANYTAASGATATSTVNISNGTTTGTGGIDMVTSASGTVNSILNITNGSLSVGASGVSGINGIYRTATSVIATTTLTLDGGSLNLNGNSIGGAGANAIIAQFQSGTLSNVGEINGGAGLTKTTSGTLTLSGSNAYTGTTAVSAGTLILGSARALQNSAFDTDSAGTLSMGNLTTATLGGLSGSAAFNPINYSSVTTLTLNPQAGVLYYSGGLADGATGMNLTKTGAGTQELSGANTYTGATSIAAGRLVVGPTGVLNSTSGISVSPGASFDYKAAAALTVAPTLLGDGIGSRATLGGTGTINAALTLDDLGDTLSPGNSPGIMSFGESQTWNSFSYVWETNNFIGTGAGTDFDQIAITGLLDLTGGSGAYLLDITSLTSGNVAGDVGGFLDTTREWTILTTTSGITGFDATNWTLSTANFTSVPVATGTWSIRQQGNAIVLDFVVVPEPTTAALAGCGMIFLTWRAAARRRRTPA